MTSPPFPERHALVTSRHVHGLMKKAHLLVRPNILVVLPDEFVMAIALWRDFTTVLACLTFICRLMRCTVERAISCHFALSVHMLAAMTHHIWTILYVGTTQQTSGVVSVWTWCFPWGRVSKSTWEHALAFPKKNITPTASDWRRLRRRAATVLSPSLRRCRTVPTTVPTHPRRIPNQRKHCSLVAEATWMTARQSTRGRSRKKRRNMTSSTSSLGPGALCGQFIVHSLIRHSACP